MDLECGIKASARGPSLGVVLLLEAGETMSSWRSTLRKEEEEEAAESRREGRREAGSIWNPNLTPNLSPNLDLDCYGIRKERALWRWKARWPKPIGTWGVVAKGKGSETDGRRQG